MATVPKVILSPEQIRIEGFMPPSGRNRARVLPDSYYSGNGDFRITIVFTSSKLVADTVPLVIEGKNIIISLSQRTAERIRKAFNDFPVQGEVRVCEPPSVCSLVFSFQRAAK